MSPDLLHVVTAIANPLRYASRIRLFHDFAARMREAGVWLTVVECAFGDHAHELADTPAITHVPVRARTRVWTKENLLNLGIARLPDDWRYVAWIDADIAFRTPDWPMTTLHALQLHDVVQPWSDCYDLGPRGEHVQLHRAFCRRWQDGEPVSGGAGYGFAHPGYAWAATRRAVDALGGLIETAALGAGDHHMAQALAGVVESSIPGTLGEGYRAPLRRWQDRAARHVAGNIGCTPGTIEHFWHGGKAKRRYVERWDILARHRFDPAADLVRNSWGVIELAGNKPGLARDIDAYFRARDEDSNTIEA